MQLGDLVFSYLGLHPTLLISRGCQTPHYVTEPNSPSSTPLISPSLEPISTASEIYHDRRERIKSIIRPVIRVILAVLGVTGALIMPSFESLLSFSGSMFAIVMTVLIPIWAGASVFGWKKYEFIICVVSGIVAVVGTVCAFMPASGPF